MSHLPGHPALSHLNADELTRLVEAYVGGERVSALLSQYNIKAAPSQIRKILPPKVLEQICSACGGSLIEAPVRKGKEKKITCQTCGHSEGSHCRCKNCVTERRRQVIDAVARAEAEVVRVTIAKRLENSRGPLEIEFLSLRQAVAFLAFSRCCPIIGEGLYGPLSSSSIPFAPTDSLMNSMLGTLLDLGFISASELSKPGLIRLEGKDLAYDPKKICWATSASGTTELVEKIELCGLTGYWPEHWHNEVEAFRLELALSECRQFYAYCAAGRGLRPQSDTATTTMITNILRDYSVAQCYHIIWQGARNTSDFLVREGPNRAHAANFMVGACQRWADRARAENWVVKPFRRNFSLPRSMLSHVLMDVTLKIGECGFTDAIGPLAKRS